MKALSIIGILLSLLLTFLSVSFIYGGIITAHEQRNEMGYEMSSSFILIGCGLLILSLYFLAFSITVLAKSFKKKLN